MFHQIPKARFARQLVYMLCILMILGGQPLMALEQNIRIVPKDDKPDWLETWLHGDTYRDAWGVAGSRSLDAVEDLHGTLDSWWDGRWNEAWGWLETSMGEAAGPGPADPLVASAGPASGSMVAARVPIFAAVAAAQEEPAKNNTRVQPVGGGAERAG